MQYNLTKEQEDNQKANEKWLNKKPRVKTPEQRRYIDQALKTKHLRTDLLSGRHFRSVRG